MTSPAVGDVLESYTPKEPVKRIFNDKDIVPFVQSEAFARIVNFVKLLNTSVLNKKISDPCHESSNTKRILTLLDTISSWIDDFPPAPNAQRFGNKAFRLWLGKVEENASNLLKDALPEEAHIAIPELNAYFTNSYGNGTRIDYGSGHELSFCAWLCALAMLKVFDREDFQALVLRVFVRYLAVVRKLQRTYTLEPAGSHGVWGLDDYQFLPYLWGSGQLIDHPRLKPSSILNEEMVESLAKDYLYFGCIHEINQPIGEIQVKRGPFHEHSPMLYDISAVPGWAKVNSGMNKMFIAEVLRKAPVVQHFYFGALFPFTPAQAHY
ncbi:Serine/threonine-protein phosphatase 2A activator [Umbelopsis sp. WA50703]